MYPFYSAISAISVNSKYLLLIIFYSANDAISANSAISIDSINIINITLARIVPSIGKLVVTIMSPVF